MMGLKKTYHSLLALFVLMVFGINLKAQDPQFSQFYAAPLFVNPAFTGTFPQHRFILNYRNQWPALKKQFVSYNASYDLYMPEINSGVGIQLTHDKAGTAALQYTAATGLFAYEFRINRDWVFKPGLAFSGYTRTVDMNQLVFADQIARGSGRATVEFIEQDPRVYFDFSAGGLFYNESFWFGFSAHHLNEPNQSLLGEFGKLPVKYSAHGGFRYVIRRGVMDRIERAFWFASNYKRQNISSQLDVGAYFEFFPVLFGLWYRGIKVGSGEESYENRDAVVVMVGTELESMRFGYSYDITVSQLFGNVGGAHEFSLIFAFKDNRPKKRRVRMVPCPSF